TLSRVIASWAGTSIVMTRRSIFTRRSTPGITYVKPGPRAPASLPRRKITPRSYSWMTFIPLMSRSTTRIAAMPPNPRNPMTSMLRLESIPSAAQQRRLHEPESGELRHQSAAAIAHERKRDPDDGRQADICPQIRNRLKRDHGPDPGAQQAGKPVVCDVVGVQDAKQQEKEEGEQHHRAN